MINRDRLTRQFMELVRIPSPSKREGRVAHVLKKMLKELGFDVFIDNAGEKTGCDVGNIIARLKGGSSAPSIILSAHMDTVSPCENIKPITKDDTIYSDGTTVLGSDDKAGIAIILEAIRHVKEEKILHCDIELLFTIHEEGGLLGSRNLDYSKVKSELGFVFDSSGKPGTIINRAPAKDNIEASIKGKMAHAGIAPETGISAIQVAARAINRMRLLRIDPETTANIGFITGGGPTNVVCSEVRVLAEARSLSEERLKMQTSHMVECIENACEEFRSTADIKVERAYSAYNVTDSEKVLLVAKRAAKKIGLKVEIRPSGGGNDANNYNIKGIKAINLGIGITKAHTAEEHIKINCLVDSARYASAIIEEASLLISQK